MPQITKEAIKEKYKWLARQFRFHSKPTAEMRKVQQEVWKLKKAMRTPYDN